MRSINEIELKSKLEEKDKIILVDFWATWCNPCKMLNPILEKLDEEIKEVEFMKINVDENGEIADSYSIGSIPTILIFKNGEIVNKITGFKPKIIIKNEIFKTIGE